MEVASNDDLVHELDRLLAAVQLELREAEWLIAQAQQDRPDDRRHGEP